MIININSWNSKKLEYAVVNKKANIERRVCRIYQNER